MSEYIFVNLIDKSHGNNIRDSIPLHMTLLHWFELDAPEERLVEEASLVLSAFQKIATRTTTDDLFDPENDVPVMRVERTPELLGLHLQLIEMSKSLGANFDDRWTGADNWNPHATHKPDMQLAPSTELTVDDVDLISRPNKSGDRKIVRRFTLDG